MRRIIFAFCLVLAGFATLAQESEYHVRLFGNGNVLCDKAVSVIDSIYTTETDIVLAVNGQALNFAASAVDSVTFPLVSVDESSMVVVTYSGTTAMVVNPYEGQGVTVTTQSANVTINSTAADVVYILKGNATNGMFKLTSSQTPTVIFDGVSIAKSGAAPVTVSCSAGTNIQFADGTESVLTDNATGSNDAALVATGNLNFVGGSGKMTLTSYVGHGIKCSAAVNVSEGEIEIAGAAKDGIHASAMTMTNGIVFIDNVIGDGIDCTGNVRIDNGTVTVSCASDDAKAISSDGNIVFNGGTVSLNVSGAQSKCVKADGMLTVNGGSVTAVASGATVLETTESNTINPSYCSAFKANGVISIYGGSVDITLPATNNGGRGITSDSDVNIYGGEINIVTSGAGAVYTVSGSTKDSYSSKCITADGNMNIVAGNITCSSTGLIGKGITCDGNMVIGASEADNSLLNLNVSTSGAHLLVSGSGPNADYANPKAVRADGNLTVNSGTIVINCTQNTEGGECLESKSTLTVNGGEILAYSKGDDAINAASAIVINGGMIYAHSDSNDGMDANGPITINGGLIIANGASGVECGIDCDNYTFKVTGGTFISTGGSNISSPTTNVCTQPTIKTTLLTSQSSFQILDSSGNVIMTYKMPTYSGGGGGWPGGGGPGGGGVTTLITSPNFSTGQTYTLKYGGTISGGTSWNNYYTGATFTGGTTKTFTINSMFTTVN